MSFDPPSLDEPARPGRLSQNGHLAGVGVFGFLLLVGFFFGLVTGYDSPKPAVAKVQKEKVAEPPRPVPKVVPPKPEPKADLRPEPRVEPKAEPKEGADPGGSVRSVIPKDPPAAVAAPKDPPSAAPVPKDPAPAVVAVSFEKQVRPILMRYCGNCHGNAGKPKGDVDLRTLAAITDPKNPPILKPGDPKGSQLLATIEDMSMPPNGPRPGRGETDVIREWIKGGAKPRRRRKNAI
jgi:hypothetical protein